MGNNNDNYYHHYHYYYNHNNYQYNNYHYLNYNHLYNNNYYDNDNYNYYNYNYNENYDYHRGHQLFRSFRCFLPRNSIFNLSDSILHRISCRSCRLVGFSTWQKAPDIRSLSQNPRQQC